MIDIKILFFILCFTSLTACAQTKEKKHKEEQTILSNHKQNNNTSVGCDTSMEICL